MIACSAVSGGIVPTMLGGTGPAASGGTSPVMWPTASAHEAGTGSRPVVGGAMARSASGGAVGIVEASLVVF